MKKLVTLAIVILIVLSVSACGSDTAKTSLITQTISTDLSSDIHSSLADDNSDQSETTSAETTTYSPADKTSSQTEPTSNKPLENDSTSYIQDTNVDKQISQQFLSAFSKSGFGFGMNKEKLQNAAGKIKLSNKKTMLGNGLVFEFKDLYGAGYAYGDISNCVSYKSELKNSKLTETYDIFVSTKLEGVILPGNLAFGSSFKSAYDNFTRFQGGESGESFFITYASWHGEIIDDSLDNASATITYVKKTDNKELKCNLNFKRGKLVSYQYITTIVSEAQNIKLENDKIEMLYYQNTINSDLCEGTIDKLILTENNAELTITAKSKTGKDESYTTTIDAWLSADTVTPLGTFNYAITPQVKQHTDLYDGRDGIHYTKLDYFKLFAYFNGVKLSSGSIYIDRGMSR